MMNLNPDESIVDSLVDKPQIPHQVVHAKVKTSMRSSRAISLRMHSTDMPHQSALVEQYCFTFSLFTHAENQIVKVFLEAILRFSGAPSTSNRAEGKLLRKAVVL